MEKSQASVDNRLLGLLGPYTSMRSVHLILARGANPSVLNRHRHGQQPWRCRLFIYHSPTFSTSGLHFPPKGPARFHVIQNIPKITMFKFKEPMTATWSFDHSAIYHNLHLWLAISNDLSLVLGFTTIDRKIT
jgi:hypothetical protein